MSLRCSGIKPVVCLLIFWGVIAANAVTSTNLSNGRRVLLQRGLQIQSLAFIDNTVAPTNYDLWASANFTAFNSWNDENSEKNLGWTMPWARWIKTDGSNPLTGNETNKHTAELVSLQYGDELNQDTSPGTAGTIDADTLNAMAAAYASWRSACGTNFLAYSNFGANNATKTMTPAGLASYIQATQPDMLMFDAYPHQYVTFNTWYAEMAKYRLAGLAGIDGTGQQPLPYAQYLDLYRTSYSASVPDEAFVRLQEFASWAFGYTFVTAFVYNKPHDSTVYPVLFSSDGDGSPTELLTQVTEANRQSLNLGPALVRLTSSDVRMLPGTGNSLPSGISTWSRGAGGNNYIVSITPVTQPSGSTSSSYSDIIVGYFEPLLSETSDYLFAEGTHFMIVNGARTGTADGQAQWYHVVFDFGSSGFDSLQRLSRDTGQVEVVPLTHISGSQYSLDLNLEGGTGDLFRFWSSQPATVVRQCYFDGVGNVVICGTNFVGLAGASYSVLCSPSVAPGASWTTNATGVFGTGGIFSNSISTGELGSQEFFQIVTP